VVQIALGNERISVAAVARPAWAQAWGRDALGVYAMTPPLGALSQRFDLPPDSPGLDPSHPFLLPGVDSVNGPPHNSETGTRVVFGIDRHHGLYLDLTLAGVVQRLRWIPAGEFWMGSSDEERARSSDEVFRSWMEREAPRHRVRIGSGFWLADSACTQSLWQALMGSNPSGSEGDMQAPVENVSWDDVKTFLSHLHPLLPAGCEAALPTEAQWEYACRAGTATAFSHGVRVSRDQVNFDEDDDYSTPTGAASRRRTVAVRSLPPNGWGLYEMHGNVREWCDDPMRPYGDVNEDTVVSDPRGPEDDGPEALRAVRGGSWFLGARRARSAFRRGLQRDDRLASLGFRFALRSSSTKSVAPEGPVGIDPGPEARALARRDAGPARSGVRARFDKVLPGAPPGPRAPKKKKR